MHQTGLVAGLDGNVSARVGDGRFLATPSASHLGVLRPEDLLVVEVDGSCSGPVTSEWAMHRACYDRPDVHAVFHAHPIYVVARTLDGLPMPSAVLPEVVVAIGDVPTLPYATTGTEELARMVGDAMQHHNAVVLERHGAVTVGRTIQQACSRMEALEHAAHILAVTRHEPTELPAAERERLARIGDALGSL